ncbi:MAG: hypothetical protein U1E65_27395 [Myxococcota bacterium]
MTSILVQTPYGPALVPIAAPELGAPAPKLPTSADPDRARAAMEQMRQMLAAHSPAPSGGSAPTQAQLEAAPAGTIKAGILENAKRWEGAKEPGPAPTPAPLPPTEAPPSPEAVRAKKERMADKNLAFAERELASSKGELKDRGALDRMFAPKETKARAQNLEDDVIPKLRTARDEYRAAKAAGAPEAEVSAKLDHYLERSLGARESIRGSLKKEGEQSEASIQHLDTSMKVTKTVRDVAATSAVALASGGTSLAVTGGLVAGGAVLKTASDEAAKRELGTGSSTGELAQAMAKNTLGLGVDAAGGAGLKAVGAAAKGARFVAGAASIQAASGAAKRGINGENVLDAKAIAADAIGGGLTAGLGQAAAPAITKLGAGGRALANAGVGAGSGAAAQVGANAIEGRDLTEGVAEAALTGAGTGVVMGAATEHAPAKAVELTPARAVEPPPLPHVEAKPPLVPPPLPHVEAKPLAVPPRIADVVAKPPLVPPPLPRVEAKPAAVPPRIADVEAKPALVPPPLPKRTLTEGEAEYIHDLSMRAYRQSADAVLKEHGYAPRSIRTEEGAQGIDPAVLEKARAAGAEHAAETVRAFANTEHPLAFDAANHERAATREYLQHASRNDRRILFAQDGHGGFDLEKLPPRLQREARAVGDEAREHFLARYGAGRDRPPPLPADLATQEADTVDRWAAERATQAYDRARAKALRTAKTEGETDPAAAKAKADEAGRDAAQRWMKNTPDLEQGFHDTLDRAEIRAFQQEVQRAAARNRRLMPLGKGTPTEETLARLPPEVRQRALDAGLRARMELMERYSTPNQNLPSAVPPRMVPPPLPRTAPQGFAETIRAMNKQMFGVDAAPTLDPSKMVENLARMWMWPFRV